MSIFFSLVLALLCFSYHACNARSFGVVRHDPTKEFQQSISQKNQKKVDPTRVSTKSDMKSSTQSASGSAGIKIEFEELESSDSKSKELGKDIVVEEGEEVEVSSSTESTVTWRVPHKKNGEQEPGFNLDYLPPKTHPPVHN